LYVVLSLLEIPQDLAYTSLPTRTKGIRWPNHVEIDSWNRLCGSRVLTIPWVNQNKPNPDSGHGPNKHIPDQREDELDSRSRLWGSQILTNNCVTEQTNSRQWACIQRATSYHAARVFWTNPSFDKWTKKPSRHRRDIYRWIWCWNWYIVTE